MSRSGVLLISFALIGCAAAPPPAPIDGRASAPTAQVQQNECTRLSGQRIRETAIIDIANILRGGDYSRSEFETSEQFSNRHAGRLKRLRDLGRKAGHADDVLAFTVPLSDRHAKYEADQNTLTLGTEYGGLLDARGDGELVVQSTQRVTGSYTGSNAFGAKRKIARMDVDELRVSGLGGGVFWPGSSFKPILLNMSPAEAKALKPNLAVLFFAKPTAPYLSTGQNRGTPTIQFPYEVTTRYVTVHVAPICAIVINRATGAAVSSQLTIQRGG